MQVGDLVRHVVHSGALGIIVDWNELNPAEAKVLWTNNSWGQQWELTQNFEVIEKNEVFS
jgi:hypothetical protein